MRFKNKRYVAMGQIKWKQIRSKQRSTVCLTHKLPFALKSGNIQIDSSSEYRRDGVAKIGKSQIDRCQVRVNLAQASIFGKLID